MRDAPAERRLVLRSVPTQDRNVAVPLRVDLLTREYPPEVYGGAGVHVEYLARELRRAGRRAGALLRRAARRAGRHRLRRAGRAGRRQRRRCAPWASTWRWRPAAPAPTWCTATPGTRTSPATSPSCCTACRTWSPRTAWSRCARGRPSSSAAATRCRRGASAPRSRPPTRSSRSPPGMRRDVLAAYPAVDPDRVRVVHNGIDTEQYAPGPRHRRARAARHRPEPAQRGLRRPDHPAEGPALPAAGRRDAARRGPARAAGRRAGHPGDRRRGARAWPTSCAAHRDAA